MTSIMSTPAAARIAQIRSALGQRTNSIEPSVFAQQLDAARRPDGEASTTFTVGVSGTPAIDAVAADVPARSADPATPYAQLFNEIGPVHDIEPALLAAVALVESAFDPAAVSPAGAQGLMQFMPATAAEMDVDPFDPASAVDGAARYLRRELDRFGSLELALAAYNAGPGAVQRHGGIPPFPETQRYVDKVLEVLESSS